ncbi:MAG: hypothetical protein NC299_14790 [Lachnospiraceae bacterium]|nr:hypothetical protein [Ruminococcus sp.]MCM1276604.1 hypothetical protein [Lachnospiraceae bacterium]
MENKLLSGEPIYDKIFGTAYDVRDQFLKDVHDPEYKAFVEKLCDDDFMEELKLDILLLLKFEASSKKFGEITKTTLDKGFGSGFVSAKDLKNTENAKMYYTDNLLKQPMPLWYKVIYKNKNTGVKSKNGAICKCKNPFFKDNQVRDLDEYMKFRDVLIVESHAFLEKLPGEVRRCQELINRYYMERIYAFDIKLSMIDACSKINNAVKSKGKGSTALTQQQYNNIMAECKKAVVRLLFKKRKQDFAAIFSDVLPPKDLSGFPEYLKNKTPHSFKGLLRTMTTGETKLMVSALRSSSSTAHILRNSKFCEILDKDNRDRNAVSGYLLIYIIYTILVCNQMVKKLYRISEGKTLMLTKKNFTVTDLAVKTGDFISLKEILLKLIYTNKFSLPSGNMYERNDYDDIEIKLAKRLKNFKFTDKNPREILEQIINSNDECKETSVRSNEIRSFRALLMSALNYTSPPEIAERFASFLEIDTVCVALSIANNILSDCPLIITRKKLWEALANSIKYLETFGRAIIRFVRTALLNSIDCTREIMEDTICNEKDRKKYIELIYNDEIEALLDKHLSDKGISNNRLIQIEHLGCIPQELQDEIYKMGVVDSYWMKLFDKMYNWTYMTNAVERKQPVELFGEHKA